jgi:endonuclease/exonuclease/phosphatase family metal-dependent hydrolase
MPPRAVLLVAAGLLTACSAARLNYTSPLGPRYAGGLPAALRQGDTLSAGPVPSASRRGDTLKVVTFNVQYAMHVDRAIRLIRETPRLRDPDVLLLQEMDAPSAQAIADSLGLAYVYYPASVSHATHRDFGDAILSRHPIENDRKIILPHLARTYRTERVAVGATIRVAGQRIRVYSLHLATMLENGPRARRDQLAAVLADAQRYPRVVLGGDFNSGSVPALALAHGFTWPTDDLGRTEWIWDMDHVLVKGLTMTGDPPVGVVRKVDGASDHKPVWATIFVPSAGADP